VSQQPVRKQRHRADRPSIISMSSPKDSWESALDWFLTDCRRRNLSTATLENYGWWLGGPRLTTYRQQHDITGPSDLTVEQLRGFETELLDAGLRLKEVANLTVDDIMESPQGSYLRVRQGKGKKDRAVPLDTPKDRLSVRLRR
jgi:integrase